MQARAAILALPSEMPAFFRNAADELAFLINEPDQWRNLEQPGLQEATTGNHVFKWERAPEALPPNRHLFFLELAQQGKLQARTDVLRDFGTAPYGIQEWGEMLTGAFRRWREMPESSKEEAVRKRMHEHSVLFMSGVLAHWITDLSQPMHTSIHTSSWDRSVPNPRGYTSKDLHPRFESKFVTAAIELSDIVPLVPPNARLLSDGWVTEAARYIAESNRHVERVFEFDQQAPFGGGNESKAAARFAAERLAAGAEMLRDVWYTAWVRSGMPWSAVMAEAAKRSDSAAK